MSRIAVCLALFTLSVMNACMHPQPAPMPSNEAAAIVAPWCFELVLEMDGVDVDWRLCSQLESACKQVQEMAKDQGSKVGIKSVGSCSESGR